MVNIGFRRLKDGTLVKYQPVYISGVLDSQTGILDGGQTWDTFQYTELRLSVGELRKKQDFREYLSEGDWRDISSLLHSDWSQSQAVSTLIRAIELFDNGQDRYAIVEAVTALEMALSEVARVAAYGIAQ